MSHKGWTWKDYRLVPGIYCMDAVWPAHQHCRFSFFFFSWPHEGIFIHTGAFLNDLIQYTDGLWLSLTSWGLMPTVATASPGLMERLEDSWGLSGGRLFREQVEVLWDLLTSLLLLLLEVVSVWVTPRSARAPPPCPGDRVSHCPAQSWDWRVSSVKLDVDTEVSECVSVWEYSVSESVSDTNWAVTAGHAEVTITSWYSSLNITSRKHEPGCIACRLLMTKANDSKTI